jgi:hypothetical protein
MLDQVRQRLGVLAAAGGLIVVIGSLLVSLFLLCYGYAVDSSAFNSDDLLPCAQCDDLLHGREVTDWYLPGAPYLFPDLLLLAPCQALSRTTPVAFVAYGFLVHLGITAVLFWLGRLSGLPWRTALLAACCGTVLLAARNAAGNHGRLSLALVHPGSHVAALLVGLFLLTLTVRALRRGRSWIAAVLYVLVGGLGVLSDRLVLVQFLAPLVLALIVLAARRTISFKQAGGQLALVGASVLFASVLKLLLQRLGLHFLVLDTAFGKSRLPDLLYMLRCLSQCIADDLLLGVLIALHLLAALFVVSWWGRRATETPDASGLDRPAVLLASLTFVFSPLGTIAILYIAGMTHNAAIGRYTLSCWFLPALLLPLLLCWLPGRIARAARVTLQGGIVLLAMQRAALLLPGIDRAKLEQPYPPLAQALDRLARERGPLCGLGGFWAARSTSWFTREHVPVNPLSALGEPWFHASNPACFLPRDEADLRIPNYRFLVVRSGESFGPSPTIATLHFGEPREKIAAEGGQIWLYDSLRVPPFDRFLRSRLAARLRRLRPYTGPVEPACLARPKANLTPADAADNLALAPGQTCEVRFAQVLTGRLLDIGASFEDRFDLDFYRGEERLGSVPVPAVPWTGACYEKEGIQSRLLPLPAVLQNRPWDRLIVRPRSKSDTIRLAHILVFAESIPGLDEERPTPRPTRLRLEAEELFPLNPGTPYIDDPDPAASGGRVRRAAVDFRCCFSYTPRLFLPPGRYRLECALKVDSNAIAEEVASLVAGGLSPPAPLAERSLRGVDFAAAGRYVLQTLAFEVPDETEGVQLGVVSAGKTPISLDYIDLIAEPISHSASGGRQPPVASDEQGADAPPLAVTRWSLTHESVPDRGSRVHRQQSRRPSAGGRSCRDGLRQFLDRTARLFDPRRALISIHADRGRFAGAAGTEAGAGRT